MEWFDGLTPEDIDTALPSRRFLDVFSDPTDPAALIQITDEVFTVPASGLHTLEFVLGGSIISSGLVLSSGPGGTGSVYSLRYDMPTSASQVRVTPFRGRLVFHTSAAGSTVYASYKTTHSAFTMADVARLWGALVALQADPVLTATAGETLADCFVYIASADGKAYKADPSDIAKKAVGWVSGSVALGATATIQESGEVTPGLALPKQAEIYAGRHGKPTWWASATAWEGANGLQSGDWVHVIGRSINGTTLRFNCLNPLLRRAT